MISLINYEEIDFKLRGVIRKLNQSGFLTRYCCVGSQTSKDFLAGKHSSSSYISFAFKLPRPIVIKAKKLKLCVEENVVFGGSVIRSYSLPWKFKSEEERVTSLMVVNKTFVSKIKQLCNI